MRRRIARVVWVAAFLLIPQVVRGAGGSGGGPPPPVDPCWVAYTVALPGDPDYGFGLPDPGTRDFLGLAAKGNIVIGDYTAAAFRGTGGTPGRVLPALQPPSTQAYAVDPSDASIGYNDYISNGHQYFNGNYDRGDGYVRSDGTSRKFYESTLTEAQFQALIQQRRARNDTFYNANPSSVASIAGVLYTNHALAGVVDANRLAIDGAVISRDDALMFNGTLAIHHDARLYDQAASFGLPAELKRPVLHSLRECPSSGC